MKNSSPKKIGIFVRSVPKHRVPFYNLLREVLKQEGVELVLYAGDLIGKDSLKKDQALISWAIPTKNIIFKFGRRRIYWQLCFRPLFSVDAVVVIQESKLVLNYLLFVLRALGLVKVCYWGHGKSFQKDGVSVFGEKVKRYLSRRVDWWFAYNAFTVDLLQGIGFPVQKITDVKNSIDTQALRSIKEELNLSDVEEARRLFGVRGEHVCLFAGSLYTNKKIGVLLEAALLIREEIEDFELIVVGAGPDEELLRSYSERYNWILAVGPQYGRELVLAYEIAKLSLLPGAVGLSAIDSFVFGKPMVTTRDQAHGPEVSYLIDGENSRVIEGGDSAAKFSEVVVSLLTDESSYRQLVGGCLKSSQLYSIEGMVENFSSGVVKFLKC